MRSLSSTRRLTTISPAQLGGVAVAGVCLTGWVLAVAGHHLLIWPAWIIFWGLLLLRRHRRHHHAPHRLHPPHHRDVDR